MQEAHRIAPPAAEELRALEAVLNLPANLERTVLDPRIRST